MNTPNISCRHILNNLIIYELSFLYNKIINCSPTCFVLNNNKHITIVRVKYRIYERVRDC